MSESKVQLAIGSKGAYTEDVFVHGSPTIAEAYFAGAKVPKGCKIRLLDKNGDIIAIRKNLP